MQGTVSVAPPTARGPGVLCRGDNVPDRPAVPSRRRLCRRHQTPINTHSRPPWHRTQRPLDYRAGRRRVAPRPTRSLGPAPIRVWTRPRSPPRRRSAVVPPSRRHLPVPSRRPEAHGRSPAPAARAGCTNLAPPDLCQCRRKIGVTCLTPGKEVLFPLYAAASASTVPQSN